MSSVSPSHSSSPPPPSAPLSSVGFRWLDVLEKDFDKNFVGLDGGIRTLAEDYDAGDEVYEANRRFLAGMGSCFVQVIHKAQTVLQNNAKFEAELIHLREELCEARATRAKAESEKKYLVCRLQAALLETHKLGKLAEKAGVDVEGLRGAAAAAGAEERGGGGPEGDRVCRDILRRLADEMALIKRVDWTGSKLEERCRRLERENGALRRTQAELESELVGARLDSKYLDKELAGRIQQIQILLAGGGTSQDLKQKVWAQIESEMHLQRSKTISNMCYSKQKVKEASAKKNAEAEREQQQQEHVSPSTQANSYSPQSDQQQQQQQQQQPEGGNSTGSAGEGTGSTGGGRFKQVHIHKSDAEELGMAILGGSEHGLPIMISEVYPGTAVGRCKKIRAGDVILAVNGDSFDEMGHNDAVTYLSALRGTIKFDLENRVDDEIDDVCDMDNRYYGLFEKDDMENGKAGGTPRLSLSSHPGRARKQSGESDRSSTANHNAHGGGGGGPDLPEVHSPRRGSKEAATALRQNGTSPREVLPSTASS